MTSLQFALFVIASGVTFASYQIIPGSLEKIKDETKAGIVTSPIFTLFVRVCGTDHIVMAAMMGLMMGSHSLHLPWVGWVIVASASLVALISAASAVIIFRESQNASDS